ncbi:MAG: precorrin-4 C(11)-methyltransferase [Nitrospirae bacterium]|nr:MAG: precorrin-4 C(11)-methyltransferase [Nitrospirota bacterium]
MIYFVGAGPGDPELLTIKAKRLIDEADVIIYAGSLVNREILRDVKGSIHDSSPLTLSEIIEIMKDAFSSGKKVVRLHSGDPSIYGAIREQMLLLDELNIPYEIVPGVSSAMAAAAVLKEELTVPEVVQSVILTRYGGRTPVSEREKLSKLAKHRVSMLIFLSIGMIEEVVSELLEGYPEDTPAAVVYMATWPQQKIIRAQLKDISEEVKKLGIKKTAIIAVGDFLRRDKRAFSKLYDKDFEHGYRKRS